MDFDGIYLSNGYIQLNKVNVYQNKFIDSYEVTIYGGLASFGRDLKTQFLTDLTSSLAQYNHTSSYQNITDSWYGNLFSGSVVYPMAEYGQKISYTPEEAFFGIDSNEGALTIQDYKPAIRIKDVWDGIFEQYGFTYIFKASFDKANRTSVDSYRGVGIEKGREILKEINKDFYTLTDIHTPSQAEKIADSVDVIQIPAFLCSCLLYTSDAADE